MAMKTQAWGWLAAGVLALGLNGIYHDGGAAWAHRAVDQVIGRTGDRTEAVLALATGRTEWFAAKANLVAARNETASCRLAAAMARLQTKMARTQGGMARFEAMSAREEAQLARVEKNRARIEAQVARVRFTSAMFNPGEISVICPRVQVSVPRISVPRLPVVRIPEMHVETGAGPV
jgi:hypothetical protein